MRASPPRSSRASPTTSRPRCRSRASARRCSCRATRAGRPRSRATRSTRSARARATRSRRRRCSRCTTRTGAGLSTTATAQGDPGRADWGRFVQAAPRSAPRPAASPSSPRRRARRRCSTLRGQFRGRTRTRAGSRSAPTATTTQRSASRPPSASPSVRSRASPRPTSSSRSTATSCRDPHAEVWNAREYAQSRRADAPRGAGRTPMSRLYVAESTMTVTGGMADHRLRMKAGAVPFFAAAVAAAWASTPAPRRASRPSSRRSSQAIVQDVQAAGGRAAFVAGHTQPPAVHALVAALNGRFGAQTTTYLALGDAADRQRAGRPGHRGARARHGSRPDRRGRDAGHQPGLHAPRRLRLRRGARPRSALDPPRAVPRRVRPARLVAPAGRALPGAVGRHARARRHAGHRPAAHPAALRRRALRDRGAQRARDRPQQRRLRPGAPHDAGPAWAASRATSRTRGGPSCTTASSTEPAMRRSAPGGAVPSLSGPRPAAGRRHRGRLPSAPDALRRRVLERVVDAGGAAPDHQDDLGPGRARQPGDGSPPRPAARGRRRQGVLRHSPRSRPATARTPSSRSGCSPASPTTR